MKAIRKIFIVALMLSLILTVATAVAADDMTFNQGDSNETINIEHTQNDYLTGKDSEDYSVSTQDKKPGSFHDLQMLIDNSSGVINLERDYIYNDATDRYLTIHNKPYGSIELFIELFVESDTGIKVNKSIQINGNGHSIDARNMTRIFNIIADNVVLKNITFLNGNCYNPNALQYEIILVGAGHNSPNAVVYDSGKFRDESFRSLAFSLKGGAIYCRANGLKITDSTFKGNIADYGGAIYIDGSDSQLSNLRFSNNTAYDGGAIYVCGKASIVQSKFDSNSGLRGGSSISSRGDVNIQNCIFTKGNGRNVVLYGKNWQIDNMTSSYYNSFVKFAPGLDFIYNLTPSHGDYHNLKITFGILGPTYYPGFFNDTKGYSNTKSFILDVNGQAYKLRTDENSQSQLNLKMPNGYITLKVYNPITNKSISKSFNFGPYIYNHTSINVEKVKSTPKLIAKNKVFNKKKKIKSYSVVLKDKNNKNLKKAVITLKINGKSFKAKTNKYGKATFKIKLNKKGTFKAKITFKENKNYKSISKTVKIKVR